MIKIVIRLLLIYLVVSKEEPSKEEVKIGLLYEFANFDLDESGLLDGN